jgi:hypothetical protein
MISAIRDKYNSDFKESTYNNFLNDIWRWTNGEHDFRICETPLFIDEQLTSRLIEASDKILSYLQSDDFKIKSNDAVPKELLVQNESSHPEFLQIDFAITADQTGEPFPKLIELQGFASLYGFQTELDKINRKHYSIPEGFQSYFNDLNFESYKQMLKDTIIGNEDPENVILLEIEPDKQKTRIDFYVTKEILGIETVCITKILKEKNKLFYKKNGIKKEVKKIYNRVIFDELLKKKIEFGFDFRDELDVQWVCHPNWFFKISKHSLPFIQNEFAPKCYSAEEAPIDEINLEEFVLKPLYSFAGSGVKVELKREMLTEINDLKNYILQEKVEYMPLIKTPEGYSKAEIRMMFLWKDKPILVNNLLRTSKGKMMGVDFNKGKTWVGSNIVYHK